jgi:bla regulator protein BlaR1
MNFLQQLFPDQVINALGWTVIHSLWQGLFLAIVLYFLLQCLNTRVPNGNI